MPDEVEASKPVPATDGREREGGFRHRLHDIVNHAELPYGYTLAAGTGGAVVATVHGRFNTLHALLFLFGAGAGFALIALISATSTAVSPPPAARIAALWNVGAAACAVGVGSIAAHDLHGSAAYFATGLIVTVVYFVGAALRTARSGRHAPTGPRSATAAKPEAAPMDPQ